MKRIIKIATVFIIIAFMVGYFVWKNQKQTSQQVSPSPTGALVKQQTWQGVRPGISFQDLIKMRGEPKPSRASAEEVLYPGTNRYWDTAVTIQNNTVLFIREHVFVPQNISFKSRSSQISEKPTKLYGQVSESGQFIYVYPASGIAFLVNDQNDTVYETWYFQPTDLAGVLTLPAFSKYSTSADAVVGGR
jgi:hypothetical protein